MRPLTAEEVRSMLLTPEEQADLYAALRREAWLLSCRTLTVRVEINNGIVCSASPIVRRFVGQPLSNLKRWMRGLGGYREELL